MSGTLAVVIPRSPTRFDRCGDGAPAGRENLLRQSGRRSFAEPVLSGKTMSRNHQSRSFAEPAPSGRVTRSDEGRSLAALGMTKRGEGLRMTRGSEGLGATT
jgi:hypothetical protein